MSDHKKVEPSPTQLALHQKTYDHLYKWGKFVVIGAIVVTALTMAIIIKALS